MKKWLVLGFVSLMTIMLMACGSTTNTQTGSSDKKIEVSESDIATGELTLTASNWKFDKEFYAIKAGEPITVTVNSIDGVHGIEIVKSEYNNIVNNKPTEITITEPGEYVVRCSIPCGAGHQKMMTKLVVVG